MSLFGAMNTAISGLAAQSASFGNISDNVANSQTVGFKEVDTSFSDYLTTSNSTVNDPGTVIALPDYLNNVQGTVSRADDPLALAIDGQGFFSVSQPLSRHGVVRLLADPGLHARRRLPHGQERLYREHRRRLPEWLEGQSGQRHRQQSSLPPIQVNESVFNPVATGNVTLAANLPATPAREYLGLVAGQRL